MAARARRFSSVPATAMVIALAAAACGVLNWPGHFSYDSVVQLAEGRTGVYEGGHPPIMSWLLGVAAQIAPGAAPFVLLDMALVFGSLLAFALIPRRPSWRASIAVAVLAFTPQFLIYPAIVWKDVLFAGALCAGFASLAWAATGWASIWRRSLFLAGALIFLALAALARQNGGLALLPAAAAVGWLALRAGARVWTAAAYGFGFLATAAALVLTANALLATHLEDRSAVAEQFESLQLFDVVGAVARAPGLGLPVLRQADPQLEQVIRTKGVALYSPVRVDSLEPILDNSEEADDSVGVLARQSVFSMDSIAGDKG